TCGDLFRIAENLEHALAKRDRNVVRIQRPRRLEQRLPALILLTHDHRLVGFAVKALAQLRLDQRALFLDDDDHLEALHELSNVFVISRPRARDLEEAQANAVRRLLVDADVVERLAYVEIALADRDDAKLRGAAARIDDLVEAVSLDELADRRA